VQRNDRSQTSDWVDMECHALVTMLIHRVEKLHEIPV
jgi:hypothetical protein